ncbi:sugar phosphate isomerase/epimerase family protein [Nakamurella deserti]|uniref:sugar phosphate isomerase/epimerase family protein n=1 Tax=Nakamurella deserti TaxID=2164074 RepID=UPI000DBE3BB8|nr:sugar phosphate isomerase/epimerase [Nakamurella deserti]
MRISDRLGCSTISFRHLPLCDALTVIGDLGFDEIDLGALPGVCDHVPFTLNGPAVTQVADEVIGSGLRVRTVNGDIGDLNTVLDVPGHGERRAHLQQLLDLTARVGAVALVLPNGALSHRPVVDLDIDISRVTMELAAAAELAATFDLQLWVESLHVLRLCHSLPEATQLTKALAGSPVGVVMDFSHVVASGARLEQFVDLFGDRIRHVHLRDATTGNIHHSIGNGAVDFAAGVAALDSAGYDGHFALELETRDVADADRPAATARAAGFVSALLQSTAGLARTTQAPASFAGHTPSGGIS